MCAEALWWRCHRRLVSDALTLDGWAVMHIGPDGRATAHELTSFAVADEYELAAERSESAMGGAGRGQRSTRSLGGAARAASSLDRPPSPASDPPSPARADAKGSSRRL